MAGGGPTGHWKYGIGSTADDASAQFVPQVNVTVLVFDEAPNDV